MTRWLRLLVDLILPATCDVCGELLPAATRGTLCHACCSTIHPPEPPLCTRCGVPVSTHTAPCRHCRVHPPAFSIARAAGLYLPAAGGLNPLAVAIQRLKYDRRRTVGTSLGTILARSYPFNDDAVLVPVPLHPTRLRQRGFNQATILATALARQRALAMAPGALVRVRQTSPQARLGAAARRRNLRGAFAVIDPVAIRGVRVVIVDDVLTTGATADGCAAALLDAGAERVDVFTVGRAP